MTAVFGAPVVIWLLVRRQTQEGPGMSDPKFYCRAEDLAIGYGKNALMEHIGLGVEKGSILTLIGPNGAGKSTVAQYALPPHRPGQRPGGLRRPGHRQVEEQGAGQAAGHLTQSNNIQMKLTVRELVTFGRFPYSGSHLNEEDQRIIDKAIAYMELEPFQDRFIDELSGGQLQRVCIARAVACKQRSSSLMRRSPPWMRIPRSR